MKKIISVSLAVTLILLNVLVAPAQTNADCIQLRNKIQQLEQMDITHLTPSIREIYKESLLKLYKEFTTCLAGEISATTTSRRIVQGASEAEALDAKLALLQAETSETKKKILILEIASNLKDPQQKPRVTESFSRADIARDVDSPPASPSTVPAASVSSVSVPMDNATTNGTATENANSTSDSTPADRTDSTTPTVTSAPQAASCASVIPGVEYSDPPPILSDIANKAAADVVRRKDPVRSIFPLTQMVLYTVFDAASENSSKQLRELEAYQYLSETARTDKQLGASANSDGAVSAIEKPGFARLLGFAVEHGGIAKQNDGTNLTLSTSLYSLYAIGGGDTAETYSRAGFLNRIGVSATFAIDDTTNELANARRNNLSEWSARVRLFGDRSTRSAAFQRFWNARIRPLISERLQTLGSSVESLSGRLSSYDAIERLSRRCLPALVESRMAQADYTAAAGDDVRRSMIAEVILSHLQSNVFNQVKSGSLKLDETQVADIEQEFLPRLKTSLDNLVLADAEVKAQIEDLRKGPQATFAYTNLRIPTGSDYSETKFLFEQEKGFFRPLKLIGNLGLSFYNKPDPLLNQERLRDVSAALSFEGSSRSPFTEDENQSRITYSFVGRYQRLFENRRMIERKPDIGAFQFVMEIPFFRGLSLPLSATYANATEEEKKNHFRFNFGMRLDTDKLFELLRAASNR